jgi:hypothetical protein|eukprot:COSAG01_NODE_441_length_17032_cov_27.546389_24_plen_170_part_00
MLSTARSGLSVQYLTSLYWSMTTLSTVGYGDITAYTSGEQMVAMLSQAIGTVMFCVLAGNVISLVSQKRSSHLLREQKLEAINEYLRIRDVDRKTKKKVRQHFEDLYEYRTVMGEEELLETMPPHLKREVVQQVYGTMIDSLCFLKNFANEHRSEYHLRHISIRTGILN